MRAKCSWSGVWSLDLIITDTSKLPRLPFPLTLWARLQRTCCFSCGVFPRALFRGCLCLWLDAVYVWTLLRYCAVRWWSVDMPQCLVCYEITYLNNIMRDGSCKWMNTHENETIHSFIHGKMSSVSRDMRWPDKMRKCYYCCECCVFTELYYDRNKEGVFWREVRRQNTSLNQRTHSVTAESTLLGVTTKTVYLTLTQILECEKFLSSYWIVFVYLSVKSLSRFP